MAGKPKRMSQIKQLLHLHNEGKKKKEIARILDISKNTVKSYLEKLMLSKESLNELVLLDDPVLEAKFHPGNPAYSDERFEHLKPRLDYFVKELKRKGVTRKLLWEEYREEQIKGYGLTQFCYHLSQHLSARNPSMVLQHKPGEKLFIDFAGKPLSYVDQQSGEVISCQVFVACLPYSDYSFVMAVKSQRIEDFLYALKCCLSELGGVPQLLVPDNLKSAITKADKYEPEVNHALEDFANHYSTTVVPARAFKPKDKALVENQVRLIYTRIYAKLRNDIFFDIASLNRGIREKNKDHNQTRMQQKPYSREECFLSNEKHLLGALPSQDFELKYYRLLKVAKNNHIFLTRDKHYYSVPYTHIGAIANVIYTRSMVYIYVAGKQVAVHQRNYSPGRYSTEKEHLCSHHQHYLDRSPDHYLQKAKSISEIFYQLISEVFNQNRHPEQLYRTCDGFMSLQRKTDSGKFTRACTLALDYKNYSYHFLANVIKNNTADYLENDADKTEKQQQKQALPKHQNIRGKEYYKQINLNF